MMPFTPQVAGTGGTLPAKFQPDPCTYAGARALLRYERVNGIPKTFFCSFSLRNAPNVDVSEFIGFIIES